MERGGVCGCGYLRFAAVRMTAKCGMGLLRWDVGRGLEDRWGFPAVLACFDLEHLELVYKYLPLDVELGMSCAP